MGQMFRFLTVGEPHGEAFAADDERTRIAPA